MTILYVTQFRNSIRDSRILNLNVELSIIPKYFWQFIWATSELFNTNGRSNGLMTFQLNIISWPCFRWFGLKLTFHWYVQLLVLARSSFNSFCDKLISWTTENRDGKCHQQKNFELNLRSSDKSLIHIRNIRSPTQHWI